MKVLLKKGCLAIFIFIGLAIALPFVWRAGVKLFYRADLHTLDATPDKPVAIVFGAAVYGNERLSPILRDRVETAIELYESGRVSTLIMSGDNSSEHYDEPGAMTGYAIERGVDPDDIIIDRAGHRTYDTCYRALHVFEVKQATLVTQAFHLPRALMTCEGLGINAVGTVADKRLYRGAGWYEFRETAATIVGAWDVIRRQPPPLLETTQDMNRSWPATLADSQ